MDQSKSKSLFKELDKDNSGTISLNEFIELSKKSLEITHLMEVTTDHGSGGEHSDELQLAVQQERFKVMAAIEQRGVRLQRTMSTYNDPRLQGNVEMLHPGTYLSLYVSI